MASANPIENSLDGVAASSPTAAPSPYRPHRCHPRLADAVHTVMAWEPWAEKTHRFGLLAACYRSAPGSEPRDAHLLDPALQLPIVRRPFRLSEVDKR